MPSATTLTLRAPLIVAPLRTAACVVLTATLTATERPTPKPLTVTARPSGSALVEMTVVFCAWTWTSVAPPGRFSVAPAAM